MMDEIQYYLYERLIEDCNVNNVMVGKFLGKLANDRNRYFVRYSEYDDDESDYAVSYNGIKFHRQVVEFIELIKTLYGRQRVYSRLPKDRRDIIEHLLDHTNKITPAKIHTIHNMISDNKITVDNIVAIKLML